MSADQKNDPRTSKVTYGDGRMIPPLVVGELYWISENAPSIHAGKLVTLIKLAPMNDCLVEVNATTRYLVGGAWLKPQDESYLTGNRPSEAWGVWIQGSDEEADWYTYVDGTRCRPTREQAESTAKNLNSSRAPGVLWTATAKPYPLTGQRSNEAPPGESIPHDWWFIFASENDFGSKDTISQCARCGLVKHDYEYDDGKRSPNYPTYHFRGMGVPERECTRGDMTEERAMLDAQRTQEAWRVLVNDDGEPYAVEKGSSLRGVDTDHKVEPRRAPPLDYPQGMAPDGMFVGALVRNVETGTLGIVKQVRLRGADVAIGKHGKTQYWCHPEVVGMIVPRSDSGPTPEKKT